MNLLLCPSVTSSGEWQTQFDPLVTSKGEFYLDNQNSVSVDMMKSAQYPLRVLDDHELKAQVIKIIKVPLQVPPDNNGEKSKENLYVVVVQVASFPFKGNTSFLVVQPTPGSGNVSAVLPKLNISDLYRRLPQERMMQVNLPKIKLQHQQELQDTLTNMGEY